MKLVLLLILTLCVVPNSYIEAVAGIELSYEDLKKMNASCHNRDSCDEARYGDSPETSSSYACSCDRLCSKLGTCCIDAPHRNALAPTVKPKCRTADNSSISQGFYMVDRCLIDGEFSPIWERLCEEEWKGEDNIMKIAPVTSLFTSMTYKNYFCFRCHERTHDFLFWNVELRSHHNGSGVVSEDGDFGVVYDRDNRTWKAKDGDGTFIPVNIRFTVPNSIRSLAVQCEPDTISKCASSWEGEDLRDKCGVYTAVVYIKKDGNVLKYKNVHCALCNFESLENLVCEHHEVKTFIATKLFSFTYLIDINRSDRDRVGKTTRCEENSVWNPYKQKCSKLTCAIPGYIVKDGKCAPP